MRLSGVIRFLSCIPFINRGGCGIAALSIVRWMEINMPNTPVGIVFLYSFMDEDDADVNMSLIKDGNIKSVYVPSHIIIILDNGRIINTDREFATSYYSAAHSGISSEELVTLINHGNWNSMFNRKYIPSIQKVLGISLQDIYY